MVYRGFGQSMYDALDLLFPEKRKTCAATHCYPSAEVIVHKSVKLCTKAQFRYEHADMLVQGIMSIIYVLVQFKNGNLDFFVP
jgi:hypothetical protein